MSSNRLKLDFSLQTAEERLQFLDEYLPTLTFTPNEHEQETLSDYILWGKNSESGLNSQQEGYILIKEWAPNSNIESLEGLLEIPGFQETRFQHIGGTHYKTKRITFNRTEALQKATPYMQEVFNELFKEIDRTELTINFYEMEKGKRKVPPREALLNSFTEEQQKHILDRARTLTPRKYLQLKHYLVELRTEQYTYRDFVSNNIMPHVDIQVNFNNDVLRADEDFEVRPFGLNNNTELAKKIFCWPPSPQSFTEEELKKISDKIWQPLDSHKLVINFEDPSQLLFLYKNYYELEGDGIEDPDQIYGSAASIMRTLTFYESIARLTDLQRELLHMKINHMTNNQIRKFINEKYGTAYNENYISTIYRQKILPTIAQAATYHRLSMENVFYPENFKVCKDCGKLYLRSADFFMRQAKAKDGFAPRCKICQKKMIERRKNGDK